MSTSTEPIDDPQARLVSVMSRLAAGDRAAPVTLYLEFAPQIGAALRGHLGDLGILGMSRADLDGLIIDACFELADCAAGWRPDGGAQPWTWAARRLRAMVVRSLGQFGPPFDPDHHDAAVDDRFGSDWVDRSIEAHELERSALDLLEAVGSRVPMCALLREALDRVGTVRQQSILLEVRLQRSAGDPSPAVTVARSFGTSPDNVRQISRRMRLRLRHLAESDPRFAGLAETDLVA